MQAIILALVFGIVLSAALPNDYFLSGPVDKKSDLREFMSAMNGASRLRYGKRSLAAADYDDYNVYPMRMMLAKRMSKNLPNLIDSLNGAERLRFG